MPRAQRALQSLPWVEHDTIKADVKSREVRFRIKDKGKFNMEEVKKAFEKEFDEEVKLKSGPTQGDKVTR